MPRSTRTSQASDGAASSSAAGDEEKTTDDANRKKLGKKERACSLLELSSLDPGLGARAQGEWRAASIARGSRRTRSRKRSGWDYASTGHLVCLV